MQNSAVLLHSDPPARGPVLNLHLVRSGELIMDAATQDPALLDSGSVFVTQRPTSVAAKNGATVTTLGIPSVAAKDLPLPEASAWTIAESPLLAPVVDFIVRAGDAREPDLNGFSTYYFERLLQEMFLGLLIDTNRPAPALRPQHPLTHALAVIVGRCTDPALTPSAVAEEARLSLRQLQRLFSERGTTIGREIRRARVEQALTHLRGRQYDVLSIDQIAQFVGFSSGSSLARAMAAEGYASPTRAARTGGEDSLQFDRAA